MALKPRGDVTRISNKGYQWLHKSTIVLHQNNEMVSMGDTEISVHIQAPYNSGVGGGLNWGSQNSKCQVLSKFQLGGG